MKERKARERMTKERKRNISIVATSRAYRSTSQNTTAGISITECINEEKREREKKEKLKNKGKNKESRIMKRK